MHYIGSLDTNIEEIQVIAEDDGTVRAICAEDEEYIDKVNQVTKRIIEYIKPVAAYLRDNIFAGNKIMTQELSISEDNKVLALCDLSDEKNVVEIKTINVLEEDKNIVRSDIAKQLYFQAKGRNTFLLTIQFETHMNARTYKMVLDELRVTIYKVVLKIV